MSQYPKYDKFSKSEKQKKPGLYERLVTFFQNSRRIIKIASKPKRKDYMLVFKICLVGMVVLGVLSWIIQLIFNIVMPPLG
ncbi:MAG: protein translocase SEC61 complex subunit gamma [Promethearchaeota archaeon]